MPERFTFVKKGYDPEEVDRYIETLENVIKSYKDKDNAIKNAIISAQMAADNIVKNAQIQVAESRTQALTQIQSIIASIGEQRSKVKEFQDEYTALMQKYIIDLNENDINRIYTKITELEQLIARAAYIAPSSSGSSSYGSSSPYSAAPNPGYVASPPPSAYAAATAGSSAYEPYESEEV
jgi:hypothetical protein